MSSGDLPLCSQVTEEEGQDLDQVASDLHTQHYGPEYSRCDWCLETAQLQTIQRHPRLGAAWGELYLCAKCSAVWRLWKVLRRAPAQLTVYIVDSTLAFAKFWEGLISSLWAIVPQEFHR